MREVGPQAGGQSNDSNERLNEETSAAVEGFLCPTCFISFATPEILQEHYEAEHIEPSANYLCPVCKARLNSQQELEKHYTDNHGVKGTHLATVWYVDADCLMIKIILYFNC